MPAIRQPAVPSEHQTDDALQQLLTDKFGHHQFIGLQKRVIDATLSNKDVFITMPTGKGKSLCYQLPALINSAANNSITIVISPLISLMREQVKFLNEIGIRSFVLCGLTGKSKREYIIKLSGSPCPPKLLYLTPEFLFRSVTAYELLLLLQKMHRIARFAVDEAHCISHWGRGFRPAFFELCELRLNYPWVPILCLSATATNECRADILDVLRMDPTKVETFTMTLNRPNLTYIVVEKHKNSIIDIVEMIKKDFTGKSGIIYCRTKIETEEVAYKLKKEGIESDYYHSSVHNRDSVQARWQKNKCQVIVATVAFGLGIDKSDVRFVFHYSVPRSMEAYHHETGRAGRDGKPARCVLFYSDTEREKLQALVTASSGVVDLLPQGDEGPEDEIVEEDGSFSSRRGSGSQLSKRPRVKDPDYALRCLLKVTEYVMKNWTCRRKQVLEYFGEEFDIVNCGGKCDVCEEFGILSPPMEDVTELALQALCLIVDSQKSLEMPIVKYGLMKWKVKFSEKQLSASRRGLGAAEGLHLSTVDKILAALETQLLIGREVKTSSKYYVIKLLTENILKRVHPNGFDLKSSLLASDVKAQFGWERVETDNGKWLARKIEKVAPAFQAASTIASMSGLQTGHLSTHGSSSSQATPSSPYTDCTLLEESDFLDEIEEEMAPSHKRPRH